MLQSLGLDDLTMPAFGFSIVVLYCAYSIFFSKKKDAKTEREQSLKNFESKSTDAAKDATPGNVATFVCFDFFLLSILTYHKLQVISFPVHKSLLSSAHLWSSK